LITYTTSRDTTHSVIGDAGVHEHDRRAVTGYVVGKVSEAVTEHLHALMIARRERLGI